MSAEKFKRIVQDDFGNRFLEGDFEEIYYQCSEQFRELVKLEDFIRLAESFNSGVVNYGLDMQTSMLNHTQYIWLDNRKEKAICVTFDENGMIHGLYLKPYLSYPESDSRTTQNAYVFPIQEEWFVFWGGKNEFINYHYAYESQRYAYDLVIMKNGLTYQTDGIHNEDYYAFNKEILAPADGRIIRVVDEVTDNIPGDMNESQAAGNYLVVEHADKEYSLLAHFKKDSIKVEEGEEVQQGQLLGRCGNSGNSSEPHIHFQVMDGADSDSSKSICIRFMDGKEPIQGDTVIPTSVVENEGPRSLDKVDKAEIAFSFTDAVLIIPRLIAQLFK